MKDNPYRKGVLVSLREGVLSGVQTPATVTEKVMVNSCFLSSGHARLGLTAIRKEQS